MDSFIHSNEAKIYGIGNLETSALQLAGFPQSNPISFDSWCNQWNQWNQWNQSSARQTRMIRLRLSLERSGRRRLIAAGISSGDATIKSSETNPVNNYRRPVH